MITEFPKEGSCRNASKELITYLVKYRPTSVIPNPYKYISYHVAWNKDYWYTWKKSSSKPEYQLQELLDFINGKTTMENKELTVDDLVEGEYYTHKSNTWSYKYIFRYKHIGWICTDKRINLKDKYDDNACVYIIDKATEEEKNWLNACILANKFIPKEEALKSINNWQIGDAFEVTKNRPDGSVLITGKIYYVYGVNKNDVDSSLTKGGPRIPVGGVTFDYMKKVEQIILPKVGEIWQYKDGDTYEIIKVNSLADINLKNTKTLDLFTAYNHFNKDGKLNNKWKKVEFKTMSNDELLKIAKEKYPIGCKYICPCTKNNYTADRDPKMYNNGNIEVGSGFIYFNGKWAEIVSLPEVKVEVPTSQNRFKPNTWYFWTKHHKNSKNGLKYIKSSYLANDYKNIHYTEKINVGGTFEKYTNNCIWDSELIELTDLTEIQQYLPNGHVDKIKVDVIPEYVECIGWRGEYFTIGNIYKVNNVGSIIGNQNYYASYKDFNTLFKPSTKEAYDKQNNVEEKLIPKVGDYWFFSKDLYQITKIEVDVIYILKTNSKESPIRYTRKWFYGGSEASKSWRKALPHEIPQESVVEQLKPCVDQCVQSIGVIERIINEPVGKLFTWEVQYPKNHFVRSPKSIPIYVTPVKRVKTITKTPILVIKKVNKVNI